MDKFKIEKCEYVFCNIRFPKELWNIINENKGSISFTKFVLEACKYALDNMEDK